MNLGDLLDFFDPPITIGWDVTPTSALEYLQAKGLKVGFSFADVAAHEHAAAFTVAKMMDTDLLADVKASLEEALASGKPFREWADEIIPTLQAKGWWGRQPVVDPLTGQTIVAQLGSPGRLQTIFRTNMQSAYAVGEWEQIQEQADLAPYLLYDAVDDHRTRPEHAAWDGLIRPVDDPWWKTHTPPNGWNCRCSVIQLSADELEEMGLAVSPKPPTATYSWINPRTGITEQIPVGVDPGFNHNPGQARLEQLAALAAQKAKALPPDAARAALAGLAATEAAMDAATAEAARQVIARAAKRGAELAAASKAAERAAAAQIEKALAEKTPYLAKAIAQVKATKAGQEMTATELLAVAKEKAAKLQASAYLSEYKKALLAGKTPNAKAQAAFDALPDEAQAAMTATIEAQIAENQLQAAATAELAELTANPKSLAGQAFAKVDPAGKKPSEILAEVKAAVAAAKAKQVQAQGLAGYQKAVIGGKTPTAAQKAAFEAATPDQQAKVLAAIDEAKAAQLAAEPPPPVPPAGPAQTAPAALNVDDLVQIGPQKGSNPGGLYQDTTTGTQWYIKRPGNPEQARNEVLAAKLYELAGIEVPDLRLITMDGRPAIASRIIEGLSKGSPAQLAKAADGFVVDAWLANWDVVGQGFDNLLLRAGGVPVRVDTGGALRFRAQGGLKGAAFGDEVLELESLRSPGTNPQAAAVFGRITPAQLEASAARVLAIDPEDIRRLVEKFGPLDRTERQQLLATLLARREDLARRFPNARPAGARPAVADERVTDLEQREIEASRANGYAITTDADAIEDHNVVVSTYTDAKGATRTRVALKLRPEAAARLHASANPAGDPGEIDLRPAASKAEELVRGINALAGKAEVLREKDLARLAELRALVKAARTEADAKAKLLPAGGPTGLIEAEQLLDYLETYFKSAGGVGAKAVTIPPVDFGRITNVKLVAEPGKKASPWTRTQRLTYNTARIERGRIVETGGHASVGGVSEVLRGKFDGAEAMFVPDVSGNVVTMRGYLQIDLDGAGKAVTARAFELLEQMGIPAARATEAARLELYLDRHLYIRAVKDEKVRSRWEALSAEADQAARIEKKLALLNELAGRDVTRSRYWDPQGRRQAFSHGRVLMQRADFDDAELEQFKRDHVIFHNPAGLSWNGGRAVLERFTTLVESGGQLASQADRVRRGIGLGGSSVSSDLASGGASYVFTRLSKRVGSHAGSNRGAGFYLKPELVQRSDAISYPRDRFGNISPEVQRAERGVTLEKIAANQARSDNEIILRDSVSLFDAVEYIALSSQAQVKEAIAFMRAHGYASWPDGRPLEEVIIPTSKLPYR